ncbi:MAG: hypothetical protein U0792_11395 [Gemmataceae bacterium]
MSMSSFGCSPRTSGDFFVYVHTLVNNHTDAEEVLQNTNLVLWREFHTFESGTNSPRGPAASRSIRSWPSARRSSGTAFSSRTTSRQSRTRPIRRRMRWKNRPSAGRLSGEAFDDQRELIRLRYTEEGSIEAVAKHVRRTVDATDALSCIRHTLHECVTRTLARENRA